MSFSHLRDTVRKSRKNRRCWLCGEAINIGDKYIERISADSIAREISVGHLHFECEKESSKWSQDDWEVTGPYEMPRPTLVINPA